VTDIDEFPTADGIRELAAEHGDEVLDEYQAYVAGVNVGLEIEQTGRANEMGSDEFHEYLFEMFLRRRGPGHNRGEQS